MENELAATASNAIVDRGNCWEAKGAKKSGEAALEPSTPVLPPRKAFL
jgi:hypothetical protein